MMAIMKARVGIGKENIGRDMRATIHVPVILPLAVSECGNQLTP
jgi:hypothetical protein